MPEPEDDQLTTEGTDLAGFSPRLRFILDSVLGPSAASRTLTRALRDKGVCSTIEMGNLADTPEELSSAFGDEPEGLLATWAACCRECEASVEAFARLPPAPPPEEAPPPPRSPSPPRNRTRQQALYDPWFPMRG